MISFRPFIRTDLPLYYEWAEHEWVKNTWFLPQFEPVTAIEEKIGGHPYDCPYLILHDERPIGYLQACNLDAYHAHCPDADSYYRTEPPATWCMDLFIGEEDCLGRGLGTEAVRNFIELLFGKGIPRIVIDPDKENQRAIRCYEKAGFRRTREADGHLIMAIEQGSNR